MPDQDTDLQAVDTPPAESGGGSDHWAYETPEVKDNVDAVRFLQKYKTPGAANKALFDAQTQLGKKIKLPESLDKLSEEERQQVSGAFKKLYGVPDKTEGYDDINFTDGINEELGQTVDEGMVSAFKGFALEAGFTKEQTQKGVAFWNKIHAASLAQTQKQLNEAEVEGDKVLRAKWGSQTDRNFELVKRAAMAELGVDRDTDPKFVEWYDKIYRRGAANDPVLISLMLPGAKEMVAEGKIPGTSQSEVQRNDDATELASIKKEYDGKMSDWTKMVPARLKYLMDK